MFARCDPCIMDDRDELVLELEALEQFLLQAEREGRTQNEALLTRLRQVNEQLARLRAMERE